MEISIHQLSTQYLQLLELLERTGEEITLVDNGQAIAKLIPILPNQQPSFLGYMQNSVVVKGDIVAPLEESWEVCE